MSGKQEVSRQEITKSALQKEGVPNLYMNGFISGIGLGDAYLVLQTNGKTTAVINMSLSAMKTLAHNLMTTIKSVEEKLEQETPTLKELQEQFLKE